MALWSEALPLTASYISPLPGFDYLLGHVRKKSVTKSVVSRCFFVRYVILKGIQSSEENVKQYWVFQTFVFALGNSYFSKVNNLG